jgi:hypothetical protein
VKLSIFGKLIATSTLALALTGCIDVEMDVALTSETTARTTTTQVMSAEFYEMVSMAGEEGSDEEGFCVEGELTENADGSAICVEIAEGTFEELGQGDEDGMVFTLEGPNLVRVTLPMDGIEAEVGADDELDAETRAMMQSMFEGRTVTLSVSGVEIVETNMEKSADGKSASVVLDFMDIIDGKTGLEGDLFALVRTP